MAFLERNANSGSVSTGYDIENSCKFEIDNNEWLYRNSPTAGNRKTFTISLWLKRACLGHIPAGGDEYLAGQGSSARYHFAGDTIRFMFAGNSTELESSRKYRDPSAWYHIVLAVDTTQGTNTNRVKLYTNGVQQSWSNSDWPSQNAESDWMNTNDLYIGTKWASNTSGEGDNDLSGYLSEVVLLDGTAASPTSFGEFDEDSGIWKPIDVSGLTFGSQGFYLNFSNASSSGEDFSGNDNDLADSNLAAAGHSTDTPTNSFCTMNPLWAYANAQVISEGGTKTLHNTSTWAGAKASFGVTSGKWYWEYKTISGNGTDVIIGIQTDEGVALTGNSHNIISTAAWYIGGEFWIKDSTSGRNDTDVTINTTASHSDTYAFALDLDSSPQTISVYQNNALITNGGAINIDGLSNKTVFPFVSCYNNNGVTFNFGGYTVNSISSAASDANGYGTFEYAPPSGYYALCTKNLAEYG